MTRPVENLLPLSMEPAAVPFMNLYHDALHELVCFGTHMLAWNLEKGKGMAEERNEIDLVDSLLFRHALELIDAISVQVQYGVIVPCKVQLRALLETSLGLEYLLEENTRQRAASFLIVDHFRKLNSLKQLIPDTEENKKLLEKLTNHGFVLKAISPIEQAIAAYKNQQDLINNSIYDEVREEYLDRTSNNTKRTDIKWYALFKGPASVKALAERMNRFDLYEFFYKSWSNPTHGTDLSTNVLLKGDNGQSAIVQLRNMEEANSITQQAMTNALFLFFTMSQKALPDHKTAFSKWFLWYKEAYRIPVDQAA